MTMLWTLHWLNKHTCFTRIQRGCSAAYYLRANSPRRACAEGDPTVSGQDGEMLRMVEEPEDGDSSETVLRSLDELQPGGNVNHVIPRRYGCAYTLFQGKSAKSSFCSSLFFLNILTTERCPWWSIVSTDLFECCRWYHAKCTRKDKSSFWISDVLHDYRRTKIWGKFWTNCTSHLIVRSTL